MIDYVMGHKLFDELMVRSRIDTHRLKITAINTLCTILVRCSEVIIYKFRPANSIIFCRVDSMRC
jgi:hypothetical protein